MYYSISIGGSNTYNTWHLIPMERPAISPPPKKKNTIDIPGANGDLDLSNALTKYPTYSNRTGSIEFMVEPDHVEHWQNIYSNIMDTLSIEDTEHGGKIVAIMEEDPEWSYVGSWSVNQWKTNKSYSTITLDYDLYPFKKRIYDSITDWFWDSMNFENGVIHNRDVDGSHYRFFKNVDTDDWEIDSVYFNSDPFTIDERIAILGVEPCTPEVTVIGGPITIRYSSYFLGISGEVILQAGTYTLSELVLYPTPYFYINAIGHGTLIMRFTPGGM